LFVRHYDFSSRHLRPIWTDFNKADGARQSDVFAEELFAPAMPDECGVPPDSRDQAGKCGAELMILDKESHRTADLSSGAASASHGWSIWNRKKLIRTCARLFIGRGQFIFCLATPARVLSFDS
jgi:hypothetical protein